MAVISAICALPFLGSVVGGSAGLAMKVIGHGLTFAMATEGTVEAVGRAVDAYQNGNLSWWNALDVGINALGMGLAGRALGNSLGSALAGKTEAGLISNAILRVKERAASSGNNANIYYHVTTAENAQKIIESGELRSGKWESHVFAWT